MISFTEFYLEKKKRSKNSAKPHKPILKGKSRPLDALLTNVLVRHVYGKSRQKLARTDQPSSNTFALGG